MSSHQAVAYHQPSYGTGARVACRCCLRLDVLGPHAWIALALTLLVAVFTSPAKESGAWIWVLALLFIGMPHGGYDLEAIRSTTRARSWASTLRPFAIYTLVMLACLMALIIVPTSALIAFLLLTIHHFGHSDSVWTRHHINPRLMDRLPAWGHGTVVIAGPFLFAPAPAWAPFETIATTLGASVNLAPANLQLAAALLLAVAATFLSIGITRLFIEHRFSDALRQLMVVSLAFALAACAPPLVAVGAYFLAVHAMGHCLTASTPPRSDAIAPSVSNVFLVHARSLPLLIPSIAIVLALSLIFVDEPGLPNRIALAFLLFCSAATLPHHMLWAGSKLFDRSKNSPTHASVILESD